MLSFKEGDVSALQTLVEMLADLDENDFTTDSWANYYGNTRMLWM